MRCQECRFENPDDAKFCMECGNHLTAAAPQFEKPVVEAERKQATVLFSDLAGYTALTEKLDPEEVKEVMGRIFAEIGRLAKSYDGTIERFFGDEVLLLFGVPKAHEDDPVRAIRVAVEIHALMNKQSARFNEQIGQPLAMHIGINTGLVITGDEYIDKGRHGLTGDAVNLAARLTKLSKPGETLVGPETYRQATHYFEFEALGPIEVKGKAEPIQIYKVLSPRKQPTKLHRTHGARADLIGRDVEMAILEQSVEKLEQGQGTVIAISGDAGTGKSRLTREFKERLDLDKIQWYEGHAYGYTQNTPYYPLIDLLTHTFGIEEVDSSERIREKIESGVAFLLGADNQATAYIGGLFSLSYPEAAGVSPEYWKTRLQASIKEMVAALAKRGPTVICFEDLHWADLSFIELLISLLRIPSHSILFVCVYRPTFNLFDGQNPEILDKDYHEIQLHELSTLDAQSMLRSLLKSEDIPAELTEFVGKKAEGNPFYLEEFINSLIESGILIRESCGWKLTRTISEANIPSSINGVLSARIDRLQKSAKRILQEASVIGREFAFGILDAVTEMKGDLKSNLLKLQGLEFIYEKNLFPELEYIFRHALTQEVAYNSLLITHRKVFHEKIARAIETLYPERLEEFCEMLALHYSRSEEQEKAYHYLKLSGDKAYSRFANWESYRYYREAIAVCNRLPQTESVRKKGVEARFCLFPPAIYLGFPEDSLQFFKEGADESRKLGELLRAAEFEARLTSVYAFKGKPILAAQHGERCFEEAERTADLDMMAGVARDLCAAYAFRGAYRKVLILTSKVIPLLEKENRHEVYGKSGNFHGRLCIWAGMALGYLGRFGEGIASCEKARRAALRYNNTAGIGFSEMTKGVISNVRGDGKAAVEHLQRAREIHERMNATVMLGPTWANLGYGHMLQGDPETGQKHAEQGLDIQIKAGLPYQLSSIHLILGECSLRLHDREKTLYHVKESLRLARLHEERHIEGQALMLLGWNPTRFDSLESRQMEILLQESLSIFTDLGTRPHCALAHLHLGQAYTENGQTEKAREHLRTAAGMFQEMGMGYWLKMSQDAQEGL